MGKYRQEAHEQGGVRSALSSQSWVWVSGASIWSGTSPLESVLRGRKHVLTRLSWAWGPEENVDLSNLPWMESEFWWLGTDQAEAILPLSWPEVLCSSVQCSS